MNRNLGLRAAVGPLPPKFADDSDLPGPRAVAVASTPLARPTIMRSGPMPVPPMPIFPN